MHTMVDELYDRSYQSARSEMNDAIISFASRFWQAFANPFRVLHRIEYSEPWAAARSRCK
jgi:hypothetical protein